MSRFFLAVCLGLGLTSCTTYSGYSSTYRTYPPSPSNGYIGLIATDFVKPATSDMAAICQPFGGLDYSSIRDEPIPNWKLAGVHYKSYRCNGPVTPKSTMQNIATPPTQNTQANNILSIGEAKDKCTDLGFIQGTELFGNCVLKLSK